MTPLGPQNRWFWHPMTSQGFLGMVNFSRLMRKKPPPNAAKTFNSGWNAVANRHVAPWRFPRLQLFSCFLERRSLYPILRIHGTIVYLSTWKPWKSNHSYRYINISYMDPISMVFAGKTHFENEFKCRTVVKSPSIAGFRHNVAMSVF